MHLVNVIHRLNLFLFDWVVGFYNEILKQKQVTVLLIFPFYENLEDLETLGIFFSILETKGWLWGVAASLQWGTYTPFYLSCRLHLFMLLTWPLHAFEFAITRISEDHKDKIPPSQYFHSLHLLPLSRILCLFLDDTFTFTFQQIPAILLANKSSLVSQSLCHHLTCLTCLPFRNIMERHFVSLNI